MIVDKKIYDEDECLELFEFLDQIEVEYRKPYMRFGKTVHVKDKARTTHRSKRGSSCGKCDTRAGAFRREARRCDEYKSADCTRVLEGAAPS